MTAIKLNNNDLRKMVNEAVSVLLERKEEWFMQQKNEPLCRFPYFVFMNLSDHAIDRKFERRITRQDIFNDLQTVVQDVIKDFQTGNLDPKGKFLVVNRDSCLVVVVGVDLGVGNGKKIKKLIPVTAFIWDGRVNLNGKIYYVGEESPAYLEARDWNEENQDAVLAYKDWKHAISDQKGIKDQRKKADRDYYFRTHPQPKSHERMVKQLDMGYGRKYKDEKKAIHKSLPDGDLDAIQKFYKDMKNGHVDMEPLQEFVRRLNLRPISEALEDSTNANMAAAKKAQNDEFYTQREDVDKELVNYADEFRGKSIYCPCDGPQSQIFQYFRDNFGSLGIKDLCATSFSFTGKGYIIYVDENGQSYQGELQGDGDFRSEECQRLMSKCDIVVTNPPFSLFSDIVKQCEKHGKKFLLLGNKNAASTVAVFSLMKTGNVKYGYTKPGEFIQPEGDEIKRMGGLTRWFTNLPVKSDKKFSPTAEFDPERHIKPDNETDDIINVDSIRDVPYNYEGKMLVPITIFDQGLDFNEYNILKLVRPVIGGKKKFVRVLIQKKQGEEQPQGEPALAQAVMNEVIKRLRKLL